MPKRPVDAIAEGACAGLPVIAGSTHSEWRHYIVPNGFIDKVDDAKLRALWTNAGLPAGLPEAYRRAGRGTTPGDVFAQIQSDIIFRMPCMRLIESLRKGGARVWAYSFDWESPIEGPSGARIGQTAPKHRSHWPMQCTALGANLPERTKVTGPNTNSARAAPSPSRQCRDSSKTLGHLSVWPIPRVDELTVTAQRCPDASKTQRGIVRFQFLHDRLKTNGLRSRRSGARNFFVSRSARLNDGSRSH